MVILHEIRIIFNAAIKKKPALKSNRDISASILKSATFRKAIVKIKPSIENYIPS